jgi:hypothetical protein
MINDIFEDFEYFALQTTDSSLFGQIDKLIVFEDKYFILDKRQMRQVFVFEKDGTFSHTIGEYGPGRGEYGFDVADFTIDKENRQLMILIQPSMVFIYSLDGKFIEHKNLHTISSLWHICSYNNGIVCSADHIMRKNNASSQMIYIFDKDFTLKNKLLNSLTENIKIFPVVSNCLFDNNNKVAYFDEFTYTLYPDVTNGEEKESVYFALNNKVPLEVFADSQHYFDNQQQYSYFIDLMIIGDTVTGYYINGLQQCVLIMNIKNGKKILARSLWMPTILCHKEDYLYSCIRPDWILEDATSGISAENMTQYPVEIDSNPVIVRFKMKKGLLK